MVKAMERLQVQIRDQETELTQLRNRPIPSAHQGSAQHGEPAATVHLLSAQLSESERQWKTWHSKANTLEHSYEHYSKSSMKSWISGLDCNNNTTKIQTMSPTVKVTSGSSTTSYIGWSVMVLRSIGSNLDLYTPPSSSAVHLFSAGSTAR